MNVIRDNEAGGIMMIPLIVDWHISRTCQIRDCVNKTNTIVCFEASECPDGKAHNVGVCENHYQEATEKGKFNYTIDL